MTEFLVVFGSATLGAVFAWAAFLVRHGDALRPLSRKEALELYESRRATLAELQQYERSLR